MPGGLALPVGALGGLFWLGRGRGHCCCCWAPTPCEGRARPCFSRDWRRRKATFFLSYVLSRKERREGGTEGGLQTPLGPLLSPAWCKRGGERCLVLDVSSISPFPAKEREELLEKRKNTHKTPPEPLQGSRFGGEKTRPAFFGGERRRR